MKAASEPEAWTWQLPFVIITSILAVLVLGPAGWFYGFCGGLLVLHKHG